MTPSKAVYLIATLDTKGIEAAFVRDVLASLGVSALIVDAGCQETPARETGAR